MARRAVPLALLATGLALGIASVATGRAHPGWWFAGESDAAPALMLLTGLGLIGAGAGGWQRHPASRFGPLLWLAGVAWFIPEWNNPEIGSSLAFTAGLVFVAACPPLVAHAALAYPGGRLRSPAERVVIGLAYVACLGLVGALSVLLFDPAAEGCAQCPRNLLLVSAHGDLAHDLQRAGLQLGPLWAALVLGLAAGRVARGSVAERRLILPVLVPAGAYLVAVAWSFQHSAGRGFLGNDSLDLSLWAAQAATLCLLAAGASWEWVRNKRTRSALAALVVDLESSPGPGGLRAALAERLGDPSLELLHELPNGRLIDAAGLCRAPNPDQQLTPLVSEGRTLAIAEHRPGLFDDVGLGQEVASAARLALDNDRLQAELRAQLEDLRASRARIVEAGDAERRRLERDLHDGAQQRLVALGLSIGLAIAQQGGRDPRLERAKRELRELLTELRELAHGIYPVALAEEGLAAAVDALAEESRVALRLERPLPEDRLDPQVESAAYLVVREMVRDGRRTWSSVDARREGDHLVLEVAGDGGPPDEFVLLEDRVGAVGGGLELGPPAQGVTRLRAELPCG
jgi:signal transduction histidine kinase